MYGRLVAYYVEDGEADVTISPVENNVFFLIIDMPQGWGGGNVKL
ncbi:MAG: hypothetical protein QW756_00195 [Nitrososphaerota archaeon]